MPGSNADQTTGLTLTTGTSAFTCQITSFGWSGLTRDAIETTHLGTAANSATKIGNRTYIPSDLIDPGELQFNGYQSTLMSAAKGPEVMKTAAETITVTYPLTSGDGSAATAVGSGFFTSYEQTGERDGVITFTATIKWTSEVTISDAA